MPDVKPSASQFVRSSHSFAGVDIQAMFGNVRIGTLQALSYAITREKAPIYTMGAADPRAFSRGKRAIAGSLVFIMFDRHPLLSYMSELKFVSDKEEVRFEYNPDLETGNQAVAVGGGSVNFDFDAISGSTNSVGAEIADQVAASAWYVDQIPPFDINVVASNEYGANATMSIYNVEITDEGHGMSVDDVQLGHQMKWIGRFVMPWNYIDVKIPDAPISKSDSPSG